MIRLFKFIQNFNNQSYNQNGFSETNFLIRNENFVVLNLMHNVNEELSIQFLNLNFIKFIVENAES